MKNFVHYKNGGLMRNLIFLLLFLINISSYALTTVKIILPESEKDVRYSYYLDLLKLSLDKTTKKYGKYEFDIQYRDVTRKRLISYLAEGSPDLDVIWTGTTMEREKIMLPIRIPLLKGLKGCRLLLINKDKKDVFSKIKSVNELKKMTAIQGIDWPDTEILTANNFKVETTAIYEGMFKFLDLQRVDYFPRAINEPFEELKARPNLNLMIEPSIMLYYPAPNFFFVNIKKIQLKNRIEEGLNIAIKDGSFDKLFYNHPSNSQIFKKIDFKKMKIFKLDNPFLTKETRKVMNKKEYVIKID